jgi:GT2 family glycosyltransferase
MTQLRINRPIPRSNVKNVAIVALSKYEELFSGLDSNVKNLAPNFDKVLVRDGFLIEQAPGWRLVDGPEDFNFSKNVNLGLTNSDPSNDVLFISDDVRLSQIGSIETLRELAYSDKNIGMIAPRVVGPADNPLQTDPPKHLSVSYSDRYLVFVCLYIKREVIDKVGLLDEETFKGYGWDDVDYSRRVKSAGYRLAITPEVSITHGVTRKGTETFIKTEKGKWSNLEAQNEHNAQLYQNKWGDRKKEGW